MRSAFVVLSLTLLLPACARTPVEADETGTGDESGSDGADGGTSGESSGESSSSGSEESDSSAEWTGGDGDGDTTDTTDTSDTSDSGDGDGDTTTDTTGDGDGDTTDTTDTTDSGDTGSGCTMTITEEIDADQADLVGEWVAGMSQLAPQEGNIVYPEDYGAQGSATFTLDFPCDDDWHVWVKGLDRGTDDSFFVEVDGSPNPSAIFDIDCAEGNNMGSYEWEHLNERPDGEFCGEPYPWVISGSGPHDLTFFEREGGAISAIAFSNDAGYTPNF